VLQSSGQTLSYRERRHLLKQRRQAQQAYEAAAVRSVAPTRGRVGSARPMSRTTQRPPSLRSVSVPSRMPQPIRPLQPNAPTRQAPPQQKSAPRAKVMRQPTTGAIAAPVPAQKRLKPSAKRSSGGRRPFFYPVRLVVAGLGVGAIAGTILAITDPGPQSMLMPQTQEVATTTSEVLPTVETAASSRLSPSPAQNPLISRSDHPQQQALDALKTKIETLAAAQKGLTPGLYFLNPDTGATLDIGGDQTFSAASTIKVPVLVAFFQAIDAGEIALNDSLVMRPDLVATESGTMQYQEPGTQFSALETAEKMIAISDNTATNMLIDVLGGAEQLNQRFQSWGLTHTVIQNPLPDLEGTNTISPKDLSTLMLKLSQGELLSLGSRDHALRIMRTTKTRTLLPQGLEADATIAHKTGDIGSIVGDTGLIEAPNGQRYVATVMMKRPHNDPRAQELIREISRLTYSVFRQSPSESAQPNS
jgi:beta-lactamase class A